jgi:hypothetical protein
VQLTVVFPETEPWCLLRAWSFRLQKTLALLPLGLPPLSSPQSKVDWASTTSYLSYCRWSTDTTGCEAHALPWSDCVQWVIKRTIVQVIVLDNDSLCFSDHKPSLSSSRPSSPSTLLAPTWRKHLFRSGLILRACLLIRWSWPYPSLLPLVDHVRDQTPNCSRSHDPGRFSQYGPLRPFELDRRQGCDRNARLPVAKTAKAQSKGHDYSKDWPSSTWACQIPVAKAATRGHGLGHSGRSVPPKNN